MPTLRHAVVDVHPDAEHELLASAEFFETQRAGLGFRFVDEYKHALSVVADRPLAAPPYLKDRVPAGVRHVVFESFPHSVVFIMNPDPFVVGVVSGHRKPSYWRDRLPRSR